MNAPSVSALGHGRFLVRLEQGQTTAWGAADATAVWVFLDGRVYRIAHEREQTRSGARTGRPSPHDDAAALSAPMPATVAAVHVAPGQQVVRGDTLLTLEAMKMELPITAPRDGVVQAVACAVGELVQPGVALVTLE